MKKDEDEVRQGKHRTGKDVSRAENPHGNNKADK